jgi:hypothetical protein
MTVKFQARPFSQGVNTVALNETGITSSSQSASHLWIGIEIREARTLEELPSTNKPFKHDMLRLLA